MLEGEGQSHGHHAGEIELKKLGHLLLSYLPGLGGRIKPPRYLEVEERPMRGVETCTLCGATVNMGELSVRNLDNELQIELPYIAVHALVTHGDRGFHGTLRGDGQIDVDLLKDVLNYEEYRIGRLMTALLAHTSLLPEHLTIEEHMMRGVVPCGECGDHVNMGYFVVTNTHNERSMQVPYLALHGLVEHKDANYASHELGDSVDAGADEVIDGRLDMELLRSILGQSRAHAEFGQRLASYLEGLGGSEPTPRHLDVVEHVQRGLETCAVCGESINMGTFELRNRHTGHEMVLPYVAVHSLAAHGDAYFRGSLHRGWVDVPLLNRLVKRTWPIVQRVRRTRR
ncbi:MAG: hypothetical protein H6711_06565 [Myxococcales bacterium]|nr:hypothetical protein [Myxococcales bacterium]